MQFKGKSQFSTWVAYLSQQRAWLVILLITSTVAGAENGDRRQAPAGGSDQSHSTTATAADLAAAKSLADTGHLQDAEDSLRRVLTIDPASADAHFLLGYVLFREIQAKAAREGRIDTEFEQRNVDASLAEYTAGAKLRQPNAGDLKIVAMDYVLLRDYADADKWLTKSVELNPADSEAWYYLGRAKYNEERFEEAIRAFQQCLAGDTKNIKAEDNLGLSYAALDRRLEAAAAYQKAIAWQTDSSSKDSGPFIDFGALLLDANRPEDAIGYLAQAIAISPNESRAHAALGKAYSKLNQLEKAQTELETAVGLAPDNGPLHYVLGQVYRRRGLADKAKAEFERSAQLNGTRSSPVTDLPVER